MRAGSSLVIVLGLLHGCAQPSAAPPDAPAVEPIRPQPLAPPLGWQILDNIDFVVFSAFRPGDYTVMAVCTGRDIAIYYIAPPDAPRSGWLTLASGEWSASFPAQVEERRTTPPPTRPDPGALTGLEVRASVPSDHPVLARFLQTGEMSIKWGNQRLRVDARRDDLAALNSELRSCPVAGR